MKSIEHKLKKKLVKDAQAFNQDPAQSVQDAIMQNIQAIQNKPSTTQLKTSSTRFNWLLPTGLATAALVVVMMNLAPTAINNPEKIIHQPYQNKPIAKLSQVDVKALSTAFESSLVSGINAEKKALQADFEYFKSIFSLNLSI